MNTIPNRTDPSGHASSRLAALAAHILGSLALPTATLAAQQASAHWSDVSSVAARRDHGMVYDANRGSLLRLGGNTSLGSVQFGFRNDTFEFRAGRWHRRSPETLPSIGDRHRLVYDTARQQALGFTISTVGVAELWAYAGTSWQRIAAPTQPTPRNGFSVAYDEARRRLVLVGGANSMGGINDVWEYDGNDWLAVAASGPSPRADAALCYDRGRQRILMHGGRTVAATSMPLSDTWKWDGAAWRQLQPASAPAARSGHAMVFDPVRNRVVMFGGANGNPGNVFDDTYAWDGSTWTLLGSSRRPPARRQHAIAFDAGIGQVVIHGGETALGLLRDTWAFDGTAWRSIDRDATPAARSEHGAAFDEARGSMVVFGGRNAVGQPLADTWVRRDQVWTQAAPTTSPSARYDTAMVWDRNSGKVLLFGGRQADAMPNGETWQFDGSTWVRLEPVNRPSPRHSHALTFDAARNRVVLFGGFAAGPLADTWEWDGSNWSAVNTPSRPSPRSEHTLVFDPIRQATLLVGGLDATDLSLRDTWLYDGVTWTEQSNGSLPFFRSNSAAAVDGRRNRIVLFGGGSGGTANGSTLEWDGTAWRFVILFPAPLARLSHTLVYDSRQQHLVLFGGENAGGRLDETWVYSSARAAEFLRIAGSGCPGAGAGLPALVQSFGAGHVGNPTFGIETYFRGRQLTPTFAVTLLAARQGNAALPGCALVPDPAAVVAAAPGLATGNYLFSPCPIPNNLTLLGTDVFGQVVHYQPPTPLDGLAVSEGFRLTIGDL